MEINTGLDKHKVFTEWVNQFGDALYSWAFFKTSDQAIAQDLVQETFIAGYKNLERFQKASSPKTWLFSILKNKIIDHYRVRAKTMTSSSDIDNETIQWFDENDRWIKEKRPTTWATSDSNLLDDQEFNSVLAGCISNLPNSWSACLQLKYLSEKEAGEICQELNITASNLWQILHRAKLNLRNCLEINWFNA